MKSIPTVNLKSDRPTVQLALNRLERELALARERGHGVVDGADHYYSRVGRPAGFSDSISKRARELKQRRAGARDFPFFSFECGVACAFGIEPTILEVLLISSIQI